LAVAKTFLIQLFLQSGAWGGTRVFLEITIVIRSTCDTDSRRRFGSVIGLEPLDSISAKLDSRGSIARI